jgi:transposase
MERKTRRKFSADFKAKVVIEALKERNTIEELSRKFEVHPTQINTWKREFLNNAAAAFATQSDITDERKEQEAVMEKLYSQIGQLKVENDWLKKKLQ